MTVKERLAKIKEFLFNEETQETEETFVDVTTADGVVLRVNDIAVGQAVEVVEGENLVEAPDGNYELEDGSVLVVSGGMIEEVIESEAPAEAEMEKEEESKEEEETFEEEEKENFNDEVLDLLKSVSEEVKSLKNDLATVKAENEEFKKDFKEFKEQPSTEHTETKVVFREVKKDSPIHNVVRNRKK